MGGDMSFVGYGEIELRIVRSDGRVVYRARYINGKKVEEERLEESGR